MAETHLDHPGEIRWFAGYGPAPVIGPCEHDCPHDMTSSIAHGPDFDHYTLTECNAECAGHCRAWTVEYPPARQEPWWTADRPKYRQGPFLTVAAPLDREDEQ